MPPELTLKASRFIPALPATVWQVFCALEQWNPAYGGSGLSGGANQGHVLYLYLGPLRLKARLQVLEIRPARKLVWQGRIMGLSGRQEYDFWPKAQGTVVTVKEDLKGWPLLGFRFWGSPWAQAGLAGQWLEKLEQAVGRLSAGESDSF